jgi:hypothetical protein
MHPKMQALEPCTQPPPDDERSSRRARERAAREYWDRLTPQREAWVLKKMHFSEMGRASSRRRHV